MVWAGISFHGHTDLYVMRGGTMTGQRYLDEVIVPIVRPYAYAVGETFVFMDDNAPSHHHHHVRNIPEEEGIEHMDCPAFSPDMNPIEHVWDLLGRHVRTLERQQELVEALIAK